MLADIMFVASSFILSCHQTQGNKKEPPSVGYGQRLRGSYLVGLRLERRTTLVCQP